MRKLAVIGLLALGLCDASGSEGPASSSAGRPPNIVLILTDDQRWDTLEAMPVVTRELAGHGIVFSQAFVPNPLCCPSRVSILTGQHSHSTGVYLNGHAELFDPRSGIAVRLQKEGYRTALVGKYLNGYEGLGIPAGWDRWVSFSDQKSDGGDYFDYTLNVDGSEEAHGHDPEDYSTDVLAGHAESFLRETTAPLFLLFTPFAPHGPFTPAPRHAGAFSDLEPHRPPSYDEHDVSDKAAWVQAQPRLNEVRRRKIDENRRDQFRTLLAVDEAVARILRVLTESGRLSDTLLVFLSDNGKHWGEHRLSGKQAPYRESIHVPLIVRYDRLITSPRVDDRLVLNIDLAPTFADLAGAGRIDVDGSSLRPLLSSPGSPWRNAFLGEHLQGPSGVPTYCSVYTPEYAYVLYVTGEEELFDLVRDPYELENVAGDQAYAQVLAGLRDRLQELCRPPPPEFEEG